ncbi:MAG: signal peptide peptidase SppA [Pseudomonadota bacterium]
MDSNLDQLLDRKRLRRKLTVWRVVAFIAIVIGIIGIAVSVADFRDLNKRAPHIARVEVTGFINAERYAREQLEKIRKDNNVKAVILSVNSPGGTTVGGEQLHNALREVAEEKPLVASVGSLAASAGYMVAVASDHVVAPRTAIVGSIGVLFQYPNVERLLDTVGIEFNEIKSSPLKAEPSPFNETPEEARAMLETMLLDTYDWFAGLVTDRRQLSPSEAEAVLNGAVFTGKQALENRLIDAIGGEDTAKQWLIDEKGIDKDLQIINWSLTKPRDELFGTRAVVFSILRTLGLGDFADASGQVLQISRNSQLDGFLSVWQAEKYVKE